MFYTRSRENASDAPAFPMVDPADAVLRQIGEWLRHARVQRGEELDDVAGELRIKAVYLRALERGDLTVMPGRTYALGFLRAYALHLGYDGDDLVHRVKAATRGAGGVQRPELSVPTPVVESRVPRAQLLVVSLVLAGVVYGGWQFVNRDDGASLETIAEVPEELRDGPIGAGVPHGPRAGGSDPARAYASESGPTLTPLRDADVTVADPAGGRGPGDAGRGVAALPSAPPGGTDGSPATAPETAAAGRQAESPGTSAEAAEPPAGLVLDDQPGPDADTPLTAEAERAVTAALMNDPLAPGEEGAVSAAAPAAPGGEVASPAAPVVPDVVPTAPGGREAAPTAEAAAPAGRAVAAAAGDAAASAPAPAAQSAQELLAALDAGALDRERERRVYGRVNRDARIMVEALETAWIQVRSADNSYTYTRTLQPGDVYLVPNRRDLALWTGNAGGLKVAVDGRILTPLGRSREVKRDISLDPEALLARAPAR